MTYELKRVHPLRAANIIALVYGLFLGVIVLIGLPFILLIAVFAPSQEFGVAGTAVTLMFVVLYPIMGIVMGWLSGLITAAIYNVIIKWSGGLLLDFESKAV
jgi:hypothetical protein